MPPSTPEPVAPKPEPAKCEFCGERVVCVSDFCGPCWRKRSRWLEDRLKRLSAIISQIGSVCPGCHGGGEVLVGAGAGVGIGFVPCPLKCEVVEKLSPNLSTPA